MANYVVRSKHRTTLCVRVVVPSSLRGIVGKRELRRSLRTANPILGKLRALQVAHHVSTVFQAMKKSKDNPGVMRDLVASLADGTIRLVSPYTERELADFKSIVQVGKGVAAQPVPSARERVAPSMVLPDLWKLYAKERTTAEGWNAKTVGEMHGPVKHYQDYCSKHGLDPHLKTTAASYKGDNLLTTRSKRGTPLATETVNQHIDRLSAMFRWAMDNGHAAADPFARLKVKIGGKAKAAKGKPRVPYTSGEIERVLKVLDPATDERHWLPLLGMFTGARINELAQLHLADIQHDAGVDFLHINEDEPNTRVKGHKSRRVPIHPELIRRGFLTYVEQLRKRSETRLFPVLTHGRDGYGQSASKWYNRTFRKQAGIARDFHSYRHTVMAALDAAGVLERVINAIVGHSAGKSMSMTQYEHGLPLANLQQAVNMVPINPGRKA